MDGSTASSTSIQDGSSKLPLLLALPLEIKREIIANLYYSDDPALAMLRRTHSSFFHIIPKSDIRSKASSSNIHYQLLNVERNYPTILPFLHYTCFKCCQVLPGIRFSDNEKRKGKGIGCVRASRRYCLSCGITHGYYVRGVRVAINGQSRSLCRDCKQPFTDVPLETSLSPGCDTHFEHLAEEERMIVQVKANALEDEGKDDEMEDLLQWWRRRCDLAWEAAQHNEGDDDYVPKTSKGEEKVVRHVDLLRT